MAILLDGLRTRLANGATAEVRSELAKISLDPNLRGMDPIAVAELCDQAGMIDTARAILTAAIQRSPGRRELSLALADLEESAGRGSATLEALLEALNHHPADPELLDRACSHCDRSGRQRLRLELIERARANGLADEILDSLGTTAFDVDPATESEPTAADLTRFLTVFAGRENVHARMWHQEDRGTGYAPVEAPTNVTLLRNHLLGHVTLGAYLLRLDGTVHFMAIDLDLDHASLERHRSEPPVLAELRSALATATDDYAKALRDLGIDPLIEDSGGRGRHLWISLESPVPLAEAHEFGRRLTGSVTGVSPVVTVEWFPRQAKVSGRGLGNLIKLPLGIHRRTGRRSQLLDDLGRPLEDPWARLREWRRLRRTDFDRILSQLSAPAETPTETPAPERKRALGPAPTKPPPVWTEVSFESDPEISSCLAGCHLLRKVVNDALHKGELDHNRVIALRHTLGHFSRGPDAVNSLLLRSPGAVHEERMKSPLGGNPVSCINLQTRLKGLKSLCGKGCEFPDRGTAYPHPLLHTLGKLPPEPPKEVEQIARDWGALRRRREALQRDLALIEVELIQHMRFRQGQAIVLDEGEVQLLENGGILELHWTDRKAQPKNPEESPTSA